MKNKNKIKIARRGSDRKKKTFKGKAQDSRVALDRVWVAVDAGGLGLRAVALEERVAVGVAVLGGPDVGVEGVGGQADGQLLRPHRLGCTPSEKPRIRQPRHFI